mgnify:CR=1 FL=1
MTRIYSGTFAGALLTFALVLSGGAPAASAAALPAPAATQSAAHTQVAVPLSKPHQLADESTRRLDRLGVRVIRKPQSRPPERIGELC